MKPSVLVIDDEKTFRIVVEEALSAEGFDVSSASSGDAGLRAWQREPSDFVILDRNLPDTDGVKVLEDLLREAREREVDTLVVMATAYADVTSAVQALKLGAFDYLAKPVRLPELIVTFRRALEARRLRSQVRNLADREKAAQGDLVLGESAAIREVVQMVEKVALSEDTTVLIQGESGTGKELVANLIHQKTPGRCSRPFIEINCASLPENLLESELLCHEKGALSREAEGILAGYDYPGNVRELKNLVERAVILSTGETIGKENIVLSGPGRGDREPAAFFLADLDASGQPPTLERLEALYIAKL